MSLIKKIVDIAEKSNVVDARKNITKLNREIKEYKEKVCEINLMAKNYCFLKLQIKLIGTNTD